MIHDLPAQDFSSVFDRVFDAAVVGGGYAGIAAVTRLRAAGWSVLLIDRRLALLWESGWAFHHDTGACDLPGFDDRLGAIAEIEAAARARRERWDVLGYATPMAVAVEQGRLVDVALGTKSGIRQIRARRWLDATDDGELLRLLGAVPPPPQQRAIAIQREKSGGQRHRAELTLRPEESLSQGWLRALDGLDHAGWVVTHGSLVVYPTWTATALLPGLPDNVAAAVPAFAAGSLPTLADRYRLGWHAAGALLAAPAAEPSAEKRAVIVPTIVPSVEVAVVGSGTGGALAALAAARAGASVIAIDPLPFAGGIGTGGGIHWYYHGVKGGLQDILDQRVRQLLPCFGTGKQVQGFHPDAKKCALDALLAEAGVTRLTGTLVSVERVGRDIRSALIATPQGPVTVVARAWIDGTGDGDLCAQAGCASRFGRDGDGLPHAFTQSSGLTGDDKGVRTMLMINFDQGFVDATDVEDLSRARILGVAQYQQRSYVPGTTPTYIAPALGLRQARQIVTRTTLELADLIGRRRFADSIGVTGCHYDNHGRDYEFESDEGMFWVWVCRSFMQRTACDIPFSILVPQDLDNTFIASRCLGVSQDAHHSLRMQRDMQRIGEVAGLAALQVARSGTVTLETLQEDLRASGALSASAGTTGHEDDFGLAVPAIQFAALEADLRSDDYGKSGVAMWNLYRSGERERLHPLLTAADPGLSWRTAAVLAMLGDPAARPRLWQAITSREFGYPVGEPDRNRCIVPVWRQAVILLRCVGTADDLVAVARVFATETLHFSLATQLALTIGRLATCCRMQIADLAPVLTLLDRCAATTAGAWRDPQQNPNVIAGMRPEPAAQQRAEVRDDASWQLAVTVARARQALGQPVTVPNATDERALVRRAWAALAAKPGLQAGQSGQAG